MSRKRKKRSPGTAKPPRPEATPPASRRWLFRAVLFAVPWVALLALELGLRLFGHGVSMDFVVPAEVGGETRYLSNPRFTWRFFEPGAARLLPPFSLAARKPAGACRVFVLGGSAAQGDPEPGFGLARMLEVLLRDQFPGVAFEVVNAAPTAVNSHVVYAMARGALELEPDALVVYSGNNEVVGPYGAGTVLTGTPPGLFALRAGVALRATRLGQLTGAVVGALGGASERRPEGSWRGMEMFLERQVRASDPALERTYEDYERNLTDTCRAASRSGVPVVLSTVAVRLRDWGPFASLNAETLSDEERRRFDDLHDRGARLLEEGRQDEAAERLRSALEIDATHAGVHDLLSRAGPSEEDSRTHLVAARDHDTLRFRADTRTNAIVREVAAREAAHGVRLADTEARLDTVVPLGTPGAESFLDHVHLTFAGNYHVAVAILEQLREALPDHVQAQASGRPIPDREECARRLVFTELDRYLIAETMQKRLRDPPFTGQRDHDAHVRGFADELEALQARGGAEAVEAVLAEYERALADERSHWSLRERYATIQRRSGGLDVAEREWRRLAERFPQYPSFELQLAHTLRRAGRPAEAEVSLRKVLEYREEPSTLVELARVVALQGRTGEAIAGLERVLAVTASADPTHRQARQALEELQAR